MTSFHLPFRPVAAAIRPICLLGAVALVAITLAPSGATRMHATPWNLMQAAALGAPMLALAIRCITTEEFKFPPRLWTALVAILGTLVFASALASPYRAPSLLVAAAPLSAIALFFLGYDWLQRDPPIRRAKIENAFFWGALTVAVTSIFYWISDAAQLSREALFSPVIFQIRNPHPLGHSNYTAGLMILALPRLIREAIQAQSRRRIIAIAGTTLALIALFLSGSRGGLIGMVVLGITLASASQLSLKKIAILSIAALLGAAVLAFANLRVREMIAPADPLAAPNLSNVQRVAMIEAGVLMGIDRPLLGWGPGATPFAYPKYRHALNGGTETVLQLHNTPIQFWAETGLLGITAAGALTLLVAWRRLTWASAAFIGYAAFSTTDFQLDVPIFNFALVGLTLLIAPAPRTDTPSKTSRIILGGTSAIILLVIAQAGGRFRGAELATEALLLAKETNNAERAIALLQESLEISADQEIAHFNLGWLSLIRDPSGSESHFLAAIKLVPDKGGVYFGLALARLNQEKPSVEIARALALECLNDPMFIGSPWWTLPQIAELRGATREAFVEMTTYVQCTRISSPWQMEQARLLATLAPRIGEISTTQALSYRRQRIGYPVVMRNPDLPTPTDLFDVREAPHFPASVPFALPPKGWLNSPILLGLLDDTRPPHP